MDTAHTWRSVAPSDWTRLSAFEFVVSFHIFMKCPTGGSVLREWLINNSMASVRILKRDQIEKLINGMVEEGHLLQSGDEVALDPAGRTRFALWGAAIMSLIDSEARNMIDGEFNG